MIWSYWLKSTNIGDAITPFLISKFSGVPIEKIHYSKPDNIENKYVITGSILSTPNLKNCIVYGAGFVDSSSYLTCSDSIIAGVRGNMTLNKIKAQKDLRNNKNILIKEDVVIGEPCLALSKFYDLDVKKKYALGIMPHYADLERAKEYFKGYKDVRIISPLVDKSEWVGTALQRIVSELKSCHYVIGSSLHALIFSCSYGIPFDWCEFSKGEIIGDGFKYYDFIDSVDSINDKIGYIKPINLINTKYSLDDILDCHRRFTNKKINIDNIINKNPFKDGVIL